MSSSTWDYVTALSGAVVRLGGGYLTRVAQLGARPEQLLVLYDFEACPFCRKVREALSELDLEALVRPCPRGGKRFRTEVVERGGKSRFPWLVDPSHDVEMYESADIVRYLFRTYGDGRSPIALALGPLNTMSSSVASLVRAGHGRRARPSKAPAEPLHLYGFEASPYCRIARETLCELELSYVVHNVAKRSPSRDAFVARSGKMQVPWLHDPNTGVSMFESADIVAYLNETYAI